MTALLRRQSPLLLFAALLLGSCKDNPKADDPTPAATIALREVAGLGHILTDSAGHALYFDAHDVAGNSVSCTVGCPADWEPFYLEHPVVGTGLAAADFGTITPAGGLHLTTYRGWPLYRRVGETPGEPIAHEYEHHYVVQPGYAVTLARQTITDHGTSPVTRYEYTYLTDGLGRTLYTFTLDDAAPATQPTNCTGQCEVEWPVYVAAPPAFAPGLRATDFGTLARADGPGGTTRRQLTYQGRPLYYWYGEANTRGAVLCHNVTEFGGTWLAAAP